MFRDVQWLDSSHDSSQTLKQSNIWFRLACIVYEYVSPGIFAIAVMIFPMYTKMMLYFFEFFP